MIKIWDRRKNSEETELVYGDAGVRMLYETRLGQFAADHLLTGRTLSRLYGAYQNSSASRKKIPSFIEHFKIPMEEYEERDFRSFNDFFIRKFKTGQRKFEMAENILAAPAEGRYLGWEKISPDQKFPVKGSDLNPEALLGSADIARAFEGGSLLIARLCPVDYHRFHYPDAGRTWDSFRIHGKFHSVNPAALRYRSEIFFTNERQVSLLDTKNFGRIAYIEVGALCVGKIVQTHLRPDFDRGDEKGYFLFGGSTVILLGQPGVWKPSADILNQTASKMETLIRLGDAVGEKLSS
jgi:phosphatidylserine decarboxylase